MTNYSRRVLLSALLGTVTVPLLQRANADLGETSSSKTSSLLAELSSLNGLSDSDLVKIDNQINQAQSGTAQSLTDQLATPSTNRNTKLSAIFFLGKLRVSSSALLLVQNIDLRDTLHQFHFALWLWGLYPAQAALINIGIAAVPSVFDGLASTDDNLRRTLLLQVLDEIFVYPECTDIYLGKAIKSEKDTVKKDRLRSALSRVK